jgi:hypothetical protein
MIPVTTVPFLADGLLLLLFCIAFLSTPCLVALDTFALLFTVLFAALFAALEATRPIEPSAPKIPRRSLQ